MIHSLILVMLLSIATGVGAKAPSPVSSNDSKENTSQIQFKLNRKTNNANENREPYTLSHEYTLDGYTNHASITPTNTAHISSQGIQDMNVTYESAYYNARFYNDYLNVQSYLVDQTLVRTDTANYNVREACIDDDSDYGETTSMYKMAVNTYGVSIDNSYTLDFKLKFRVGQDQYVASNPNRIVYKIRTYMTNDTYASQYLDQANWYLYRQNAQIWAGLTQSGFYNYQLTEWESNPITVNSNTQNNPPEITYTNEIAIVPQEINYIYIFITPYYLDHDYGFTGYLYMNQNTPYTYQNFFAGDRTLTFNGTAIPGLYQPEVVDIPGMMWEILSMPFAFMSQAFNLTIFPGTPYQVNISNLILMIFGILVFIFIFKMLLKR